MQRKNFIGFRDRVLLHLLQFEKDVYENIHDGIVDGDYRDFLIHLTQEGISDRVGTKQSTIYKELLALREPTLEGEDPIIGIIEKVRIPGKERACAIYFLTQYGHDLATQKRTYLEKKNLEVDGLLKTGSKVITIVDLIKRMIQDGYESNPIRALLCIASAASLDGKVQWENLITRPITERDEKKQKKATTATKPPVQKVVNPYFNRMAIKDPKYFYGRDEEVRYIISLLRNTQSCSIVGPRRIGKSSLINYISNSKVLKAHGLAPDDYIFVSIDLEGLGELTQSDFFYMIIEEIKNRIIDSDLRKHIEDLLVKENIRFLDLKNIFRDLSNLSKKVVFLFDEFELITTNKNLDSNFFSGLRNLANTYPVAYITASHVPLLELTLSKETLGSPFFNFFTQVNLGLMNEKEVQELITGPLQEYDLVFSDNIIDFIKRTAGRHPFFLQILCFDTLKWMYDKGSISEADLPEISSMFMNEAQPHFYYFWNHITLDEQKLLQKLSIQGSLSDQVGSLNFIQNLKKKALILELADGFQIFSDAFRKFISTIYSIAPEAHGGISESSNGELKGIPKMETGREEILQKITIDWGNNYFVDEEAPNVSVRVFNEITRCGVPGLVITRIPTKKAEEQWQLNNCNTIWLCSRTGEGYLRPALEKISHTIFEFIKQNRCSVILLDGIEYIINNNNFLRTLNLMDNIKEIVAVNNSVLVAPMSSTIFSEKEMALLGKNSVEIPKNTLPDLSKLKID